MSGIPNRPEKITFGEMRDSGVRGVLIYCSDFRCSHWIEMSADWWPDTSGFPILNPGSSEPPAATAEPTSDRTSPRPRNRPGLLMSWSRVSKGGRSATKIPS